MSAFIGRAEAARILGVTETEVVRLSAAGKIGPVHRGPGGGFSWDRVAVLNYAQLRRLVVKP